MGSFRNFRVEPQRHEEHQDPEWVRFAQTGLGQPRRRVLKLCALCVLVVEIEFLTVSARNGCLTQRRKDAKKSEPICRVASFGNLPNL
jgi:hypothetical protein